MGENLQTRLIALAGIVILLLSISPTPRNRVVDGQILKARISAMSGQLDIALERLEQVLEFYPNNHRYRISAGELAYAHGEYHRAIYHFHYLYDEGKSETGLSCLLASLHLEIDKLPEAQAYWNAADYQCPGFDEALFSIAQELVDDGQLEPAEDLLRSLIDANPLDPDFHHLKGMIIATYDPEGALAPLRLADDLSEDGDPQALQLFRVIEDSRAFDQIAYSLASVGKHYASVGSWMLSVRTLQNATTLQPDYADAHAYLGLARDQIGENGIVSLLKAVELAPDDVIPHLYLGMHWMLKHEYDMAFNEFEIAAELDPTNPAVAAQIGAVYEAQGDIITAIQAYRAAAELDPQNPDFWLLLALVSLENEFQVSEIALPAARNALALDPVNPAALDALGYCYYLLGDMNYAETYLHRSLQLDPTVALSQYHLGLLKTIQNEPSVAIAAFTKAYQLDPEGSVGMRAKRALETVAP